MSLLTLLHPFGEAQAAAFDLGDISGTKDGVNDEFTLAEDYETALIFLQGQKLTEDVGYSRDGAAITAIAPKIPWNGSRYEAILVDGGVTIETPAGDIDGLNDEFTISADVPAAIYLNGQRLTEDVGYSRTGTTITMLGSKIPQTGATFEAVLFADGVTIETPAGDIDGLNDEFTISVAALGLAIYLNGAKLRESSHYSRAGTVITFVNPPQEGDSLDAELYG